MKLTFNFKSCVLIINFGRFPFTQDIIRIVQTEESKSFYKRSIIYSFHFLII